MRAGRGPGAGRRRGLQPHEDVARRDAHPIDERRGGRAQFAGIDDVADEAHSRSAKSGSVAARSNSPRSKPAQKTGPVPVITTTLIAGSVAAASMASLIASRRFAERALCRSGRSSVRVHVAPLPVILAGGGRRSGPSMAPGHSGNRGGFRAPGRRRLWKPQSGRPLSNSVGPPAAWGWMWSISHSSAGRSQ